MYYYSIIKIIKKYNKNNNNNTADAVSAAAERAATNKIKKYEHLSHNFYFLPIACEVTGAWSFKGLEFDANLGSKMSKTTGDPQ